MRSSLFWDVAYIGNYLQTFRGDLSVPSSGSGLTLEGCREKSVTNCHSTLRDIALERWSRDVEVPVCNRNKVFFFSVEQETNSSLDVSLLSFYITHN